MNKTFLRFLNDFYAPILMALVCGIIFTTALIAIQLYHGIHYPWLWGYWVIIVIASVLHFYLTSKER